MCKKTDTEDTAKEQEDYRIYTFFKEKPELLAGLGSVIAIALSAVLSFFSFVSEKAIVRYWNVDPVYININTPERLYGTVISFFLICVILAIFCAILSIGEKSGTISRIKRYRRRLWFISCREFLKKKIKQVTQKICPPISVKIKYEFTKARSHDIKSLSKNLRNSSIQRFGQHFVHVLFFEVLLTLVVSVWMDTAFTIDHYRIRLSLLVSACFSAILICIMYWAACLSAINRKAERELAENDYKQDVINTDVPNVKFPLKELFDGEYSLNLKLKDQTIKALFWLGIVIIVSLLLLLTIVFSLFGSQRAEEQNKFWIYSDAGNEYAVVYNNGEIAALARIDMEKEPAIIDTSKQKIVAVENLEVVTQWRGAVELGTIVDEPVDNPSS